MVILSDEEEQAKANNNVTTSTSPITMEQISQLLVDGQEKVLATVQNMIDKLLGKQPLANDSSAPVSSVASIFQNLLLCLLSHRQYRHHSMVCR